MAVGAVRRALVVLGRVRRLGELRLEVRRLVALRAVSLSFTHVVTKAAQSVRNCNQIRLHEEDTESALPIPGAPMPGGALP